MIHSLDLISDGTNGEESKLSFSAKKVCMTIRSLFFYTVISINTLMFGIFMFLTTIFTSSPRIFLKWIRVFCKINFRQSTCRLRLSGLENLPPAGDSAVYVSNHQGYFDILTILGFIPRDLVMVSKKSIFNIPFFGWGMRKTGFIAVDRSNTSSRKKVIDSAIESIEKKLSVHFFSEGTRTRDGTIGRFKGGAFKVAQKTGVPVVPLMIYGSREVLRKNDFQIYPGLITLQILEPVNISEENGKTIDQIAGEIRRKIVDCYEKEKLWRDQNSP